MAKTRKKGPLFTPVDKVNIGWFFRKYLRPKLGWLGLIFVLILAQGVVYQQFLAMTEEGLRVIFDSGTIRELLIICAMVFGLFTFRAVTSYVVPRVSAIVANDAIYQMRRDLIARLMRLDLAFFERTPSSEVILRLYRQADQLGLFIGQSTVNAARDALTVIIVSAWLIWQQPFLFGVSILVMPVIIGIMLVTSHFVKKFQQSAEDSFGAYINDIEEMTGGMRTVKIAGQEEVEQARLTEATGLIKRLLIRLQTAQAVVMPTLDMASAIVYMLVIGIGGYIVLDPAYDVDGADIVTFLLGLVIVFDPARRVAQFFVTLQANLILLGSIRDYYTLEPTIKDAPDATDDFDPRGDLVFEDVTFGYSDDQPLFHGLNLTLTGGKTTAIVGSTGSGKTTILSLLARLYEVQGGAITLDGKDIRSLKVRALRNSFSVVAQDIVIFNKSIWENIRYIRPDATEDEIWEAAENAEIADLIRRRGDAPVGPKGAQLSGGQKQRIAIARAFLRDAPIVILDEATSALDQQTEDRITRALARLGDGKTTITVAHRMSTVKAADQIYVLESGKLVEQGTHATLIAQGGLYATMFTAQRDGFDREKADD
ncbi:ATP-binding cassette subfamily B protein/subfamily B ATP-binding cassette protein MsbA [Rubricella aquisinus]|uniref:ATP-binding cassette subfamily B protein/subfamily B ATP-binding cassette protein MsbA n=1 Tax=Rubricella aquisinus TaxID=2028108 RepID=A0A840WMS3_9RHOB|nr:ABC transporter ATP-binding protein [Rubricella aquisinus]MBB5515871.1 ATP-binding cassette subfamily B protein/subfamily B ATP-binding cassette protein MsbA [Rubricella aquisinus]